MARLTRQRIEYKTRMTLPSLLPWWEGPGSPFVFVATPWGEAFAAPLRNPLPTTTTALVGVLGQQETTGTDDLDGAVDDAVPIVQAEPGHTSDHARHRPAHAAAIRHALTGALFHLKAYVHGEAFAMMRMVNEGITPPGGMAFEDFSPALVFAAEGAIVQMRSALDGLGAAMRAEGASASPKYSKLESGLRRWNDPRAAALLPVVRAFRPHLVELERVRNLITHPNPDPHQRRGFGSFTRLPYLPTHGHAWIVPPLYDSRRSNRVLLDLEERTREHVGSTLRMLWAS
jgi:hypothetical protein